MRKVSSLPMDSCGELAGKPENRILDVLYRGTSIAIFRPERDPKTKEIIESDRDVKRRAEEWVRTHGHLAEWTRRKYIERTLPNWTDEMKISPVWTENILQQFRSRKEASDFYWTKEYVDLTRTKYSSPRYSAFIFETRLLLIDHFPQQEQQCQKSNTQQIPMGAG
jgi:hypothetical protein